MSSAPVTVILPTHNHATTIGYAIRSVLEQTLPDFDLVVIGDGVDDHTRDVVNELRQVDSRIRFEDHPKHPRHGEVIRHQVLSEVSSPVVSYHGDDDLLLPEHLQEMVSLLEGRDFVHPQPIYVSEARTIDLLPIDLADPRWIIACLEPPRLSRISLTGATHTLEAYRRLPHGWRTTPPEWPTDQYMWAQFFEVPGLRAATGVRPTTLKLPQRSRAETTAEARGAEIAWWWERMHASDFREFWDAEAYAAMRRIAIKKEMRVRQLNREVAGAGPGVGGRAAVVATGQGLGAGLQWGRHGASRGTPQGPRLRHPGRVTHRGVALTA